MTKEELHSHLADKIGEIVGNPVYAHILECAREEMPNIGSITDATSIIRNEGHMQGWRACLKFLKGIGKIEKKQEEKPLAHQLYADPISENRPKI